MNKTPRAQDDEKPTFPSPPVIEDPPIVEHEVQGQDPNKSVKPAGKKTIEDAPAPGDEKSP